MVSVSDDARRVRLNLRVDEDVKRAFNKEIESKFGKCRPYAGIELEREFRYFLDKGELSELKQAVDDLADTFDVPEGKEKIRETSRGETVVASHRIAEDVRRELISAADDDYRSPGKLVEAIMHGYATHGSVIERVTQKLQEVSEHSQPDADDSTGAMERRTKTIADELVGSEGETFVIDEFDEAVKAAKGIGPGSHARKIYLPRVLDELGFTWHPRNPDLFVDPEWTELTEVRDPTKKPLILMDEDDKRLAIKLAAYRSTKDSTMRTATFSTTDAVDLFKGRVRQSTVRPLMREIADTSPGYQYDSDKEALKVKRKEVKRHSDENSDILNIVAEEGSLKIESDD